MRPRSTVWRGMVCLIAASIGLGAFPALPPGLAPGLAPNLAWAADPTPKSPVRGSGLPIPRFASLRSDEVNVRTGPGSRYPVDWVFKRKGMPVEIVAEYENWRKIRDWQGASGWVHQSLLTGKRGFIIASTAVPLHRTPARSAEVVAKLEPEVMGEIRSCAGDWCRVKVSGVSGWLARTDIWGVYKSEPIN